MKINQAIKIIGKQVILVPYTKYHVPKYHMWMKNKELQLLTASEPLSIDEEYEMQETWCKDEDKCTFIILHKVKFDENKDEIDSMIGDTNIFLDKSIGRGEIEIMIAENWARGQKLGWEAVMLMLLFGIQQIGLKSYQAKISLTNNISIQMFKKLKFEELSISEVFQEVTLEKQVSNEWRHWLEEQCEFNMQSYIN